MLAIPIPDAITEMRWPLYKPVYRGIPRIEECNTGSDKKFSAVKVARKGSPGINTVGAMSEGFVTAMCGVGMEELTAKTKMRVYIFFFGGGFWC